MEVLIGCAIVVKRNGATRTTQCKSPSSSHIEMQRSGTVRTIQVISFCVLHLEFQKITNRHYYSWGHMNDLLSLKLFSFSQLSQPASFLRKSSHCLSTHSHIPSPCKSISFIDSPHGDSRWCNWFVCEGQNLLG